MSERRKVSSALSADLVNYLASHHEVSQERLASILEVDPSFISRVRSGERSLTVDHLSLIETELSIPLGALLLAARPLPVVAKKNAKLRALAEQAIHDLDKAARAARRQTTSA